GHLGLERRHVLGERAGAGAEARGPLLEHRPGRLEQTRHLFVVQLLREAHRRHLRSVQDLVGVGVADAAEEARIGQRALERVVLAAEALYEGRLRRLEDLEPARIEDRRIVYEVQARALLGARLGQE